MAAKVLKLFWQSRRKMEKRREEKNSKVDRDNIIIKFDQEKENGKTFPGEFKLIRLGRLWIDDFYFSLLKISIQYIYIYISLFFYNFIIV